jgi:hypothetical protein
LPGAAVHNGILNEPCLLGQVEYAARSIIKDDDGPDRLVVVIDACELGTPEVTKRVKLIKDTISVLTKVFPDRGPSISAV